MRNTLKNELKKNSNNKRATTVFKGRVRVIIKAGEHRRRNSKL